MMGRRVLSWWEALPGNRRVLYGIPIAWVALLLFHQAFPALSQTQRMTYAFMEAVPVALLLAWATQNEMRRRADAEARIAAQSADAFEDEDEGEGEDSLAGPG